MSVRSWCSTKLSESFSPGGGNVEGDAGMSGIGGGGGGAMLLDPFPQGDEGLKDMLNYGFLEG